MKHTRIVWFLLAGILSLACVKTPEESAPEAREYVTIQATLDASATKTYLDGVQVKWEASDSIAVWFGTLDTAMDDTEYKVASIDDGDARQATFQGFAVDSPDYMAVYPYVASVGCAVDSTLTVTLPTVQSATAGGFAKNVNVAVAYSKTTDLAFQNVGGLMAVRLADVGTHSVKSIRLTGTEPLSGQVIKKATMTIVDETPKPTLKDGGIVDGVNYVELTGTFTAGNTYYSVALPGSHTDFTLTLVDDAGKTAVASSKHFNPAFPIARNSNTLIADLSIAEEKWHADATVYINEVSSNQIELYNPGGSAVDLGGWLLRCGEGSWAILPGTIIAAGGFYTISTAQASCTTGPMFEMGTGGFTLSLENGGVVDSITAQVLDDGESSGRKTDGDNQWVVFSTPSLGKTNANGVIRRKTIVINEVDCENKYIELYNATDESTNISGWTLYKKKKSTDSESSWLFSNLGGEVIIPASGYLVLTAGQADEDIDKGPNFGISKDGFILWLVEDVRGAEVDRIDNGGDTPTKVTVPNGSTYGRVTDAADLWMLFVGGSIGSANNGYAGLVLNEIDGNNKCIELYNGSANTIPLEGCTLKKDEKLVWTGAPGYAIESDSYVLLYSTDVTIPGEAQEGYDAGLQFDSGLSAKKNVLVQLYDASSVLKDSFQRGEKGTKWGKTDLPLNVSNSFSRVPNGTGPWKYAAPTPGAVNGDSTGEIEMEP